MIFHSYVSLPEAIDILRINDSDIGGCGGQKHNVFQHHEFSSFWREKNRTPIQLTVWSCLVNGSWMSGLVRPLKKT